MAYPPNAPNWNSGLPQSGWYLYEGNGENIVWAMTGRELVRRAQAQLVSYFTATPQSHPVTGLTGFVGYVAGRPATLHVAYRQGGPARAPDTQWDAARIQAPGPGGAPEWGPVSNAALWAWAQDHSMPQRWLDAIENQVRDRRFTNEGLFAVLWLINHYALPFSEADRRIKLATPEMLTRLVLPPFRTVAPADGLEAGQIYHWNPATENPPRPRSEVGAPATTPATTPARPGTPAPTPARPGTPATVPGTPIAPATTATAGTFLGLTGLQWGLGVAALGAVGAGAWYLNVRDERPAAHGVKFPRNYPRLTDHRRI